MSSDRSGGRRRGLALGAMTWLVLSGAACSASVVSPPAVATASAASVAASPPVATLPSAPSTTIATASATSGSSDPATGSVTIDPTLLDILPATVSGLPVAAIPSPAGADDPALAETVEGMAQAFVIDPATSDFAYSSVIALRPGVYDATYFRSWRDSFDEGACSQSGGVVGHAETRIAGRTVYIGRCDGGVSTYHVRLDDRDAIVSISAFGEHRLGELLLADLRP